MRENKLTQKRAANKKDDSAAVAAAKTLVRAHTAVLCYYIHRQAPVMQASAPMASTCRPPARHKPNSLSGKLSDSFGESTALL